jgi:plastocyanin
VNKYIPDLLVIHQGDSVEWTNLVGKRAQTVSFGPVVVTPPLIVKSDRSEINPQVVQPQGGTVIGDVTENVYSSGALMSDVAGLKTSYTFTFPHTGTFLYHSFFHPAMLGEIDVVPPGQQVSKDPPDTGRSYYAALKSADEAMQAGQGYSMLGGANAGKSTTVVIGGGDQNVSIDTFNPSGITITVGQTVTWTINETSGDLHALVFNPIGNSDNGLATLYTGLARDGGLLINPRYTLPTLPSGTTITAATLKKYPHFRSGLLYGSSVNYPSSVPSTYSLGFGVPGTFLYTDPFPPVDVGTITVIP